jgi:DNA-binding HxlR family transcriptional regulator
MGKATRNRLLTFEIAADLLGDRWSLLIVRNMLVRKSCCFSELMKSGDGIATNILASRLQKLVAHGILSVERSSSDRRKLVYSLTVSGSDLLPILTEMVRWTAKYRSKF